MKCEQCKTKFTPRIRQRFCNTCAKERFHTQVKAHYKEQNPDMTPLGKTIPCGVCHEPMVKSHSAQKFHVECRSAAEKARRQKTEKQSGNHEHRERERRFTHRLSTNVDESTHKMIWRHAFRVDQHVSVLIRTWIREKLDEIYSNSL